MSINLNSPDIFLASDASLAWGKAENYVSQMWRKYPDKFPEGSIRMIGRTVIVTREGMEAITMHKALVLNICSVVGKSLVINKDRFNDCQRMIAKSKDETLLPEYISDLKTALSTAYKVYKNGGNVVLVDNSAFPNIKTPADLKDKRFYPISKTLPEFIEQLNKLADIPSGIEKLDNFNDYVSKLESLL